MTWDFEALSRYNAERARGIVHTPEWIEKMRLEQERFDTPPEVRKAQDERSKSDYEAFGG